MSLSDLKGVLSAGLGKMSLLVDDDKQLKLMKFVGLLEKWNKAYNLTAVRKPEHMVTRHLLDSLAICPYLRQVASLDVGTGAGLPGIPLAIVFPHRHFTLLDSNNKKTRFVSQVVSELELSNVDVVQSRVENWQSTNGFDCIITRAYSSIGNMLKQTSHLLGPNGVFLAMKGVYPVVEIEQLPANYFLQASYSIMVPGLEEERSLLEIINK